ncbi:MAG: hypothetical protein GY862_20215, partial [Gammaproteobacteria bacterium]|nr:hypothetical protein [Gammaproteobacteria bacterium]
DDNGDGWGSNVLSAGTGDGQIAAALRLGMGLDYLTNPSGRVEILEVTPARYLEQGQSSTKLSADINDPALASTVRVEVRPPSVELSPGNSEEQREIEGVMTGFLSCDSTGCSLADSSSAGIVFSDDKPGKYTVFYFARDNQSGELSAVKHSLVYKNHADNKPPSTVALLKPTADATTQTAVIFDWEDATDPDGDTVTYTLETATDEAFTNIVYRAEELSRSTAAITANTLLLDGSKGLPEQTYHWRVIPVDQYGARPAANAILSAAFSADNPSNGVDGIMNVGLVLDALNPGVDLPNMTIITPPTVTNPSGNNLLPPSGGYVPVPGDAVSDISVSVPEYEDWKTVVDTTQGDPGSIYPTMCPLNQSCSSLPPVVEDYIRVLNWAEITYPELLNTINKQEIDYYPPYKARYYPLTEIYIAYNLDDQMFYGYSLDLWGDQIKLLASLADLLLLVQADGF